VKVERGVYQGRVRFEKENPRGGNWAFELRGQARRAVTTDDAVTELTQTLNLKADSASGRSR
jgi:hypothetical protein